MTLEQREAARVERGRSIEAPRGGLLLLIVRRHGSCRLAVEVEGR